MVDGLPRVVSSFGIDKLIFRAIQPIVFRFEASILYNFLWRTRLEPREATENVFSMSFGQSKGRHGVTHFQGWLKTLRKTVPDDFWKPNQA